MRRNKHLIGKEMNGFKIINTRTIKKVSCNNKVYNQLFYIIKCLRCGKEYSRCSSQVKRGYVVCICDIERRRKRKNSRLLEYNGEKRTMSEWADKMGIDYNVLNTRINKHHWTVERALMQPVRKRII